MNGEKSQESKKFPRSKLMQIPFLDENGTHALLVVDSTFSEKAFTIPENPEISFKLKQDFSKIFWTFLDRRKNTISGFGLDSNLRPENIWKMQVDQNEEIFEISYPILHQKISSPVKILTDKTVISKYLNPNLMVVTTQNAEAQTIYLYVVGNNLAFDFFIDLLTFFFFRECDRKNGLSCDAPGLFGPSLRRSFRKQYFLFSLEHSYEKPRIKNPRII